MAKARKTKAKATRKPKPGRKANGQFKKGGR